jgi:Ca2+-binding RTX toxin-like protein
VLAPLCLLAALAGVALAGTAQVGGGGEIRFTAGPEANDVRIGQAGKRFQIADRSGQLVAGRGCVQRGRRTAVCTGGRLSFVSARLGGGNDRVAGLGAASAELMGEKGDDRLTAAPRAAFTALDGGPGADVLRGGLKDDVLDGGPGDDVLRGGGGREDDLFGGPGNDVLELKGGGGTAIGGRGDDFLTAGSNPALLVGEEGNDSIDALANEGRDLVNCGPGVDGVLMGDNDDFVVNAEAEEPVDAEAAGCENVTRL